MSESKDSNVGLAGGGADTTNGFGIVVPFAKMLGIHVIEQNRERARLRIDLRPEVLNSWGVANGGVVMTMLDLAMGTAVRGHLDQPLSMITVDISMGFMSAARGNFVAEGRVLAAAAI